MMPGSASGSGDGEEDHERRRAQGFGRLFEPRIDRFDRQADRAHHQGKAHHRGRERRARPAKRQNDAATGLQRAAEYSPLSETDEQQPAGDDRRHHQGR